MNIKVCMCLVLLLALSGAFPFFTFFEKDYIHLTMEVQSLVKIFSQSKIYLLDPVASEAIAATAGPFQVIDSLNLSDDEPFTLDSFDSLQRAHQLIQTNLILARVQTSKS
jgi:hypothetical protein